MLANWISSVIATMRRMPGASLVLRLAIALAAGVALLGTTIPAWDAPDGYVALALAAAVVCTLVPDSGGGLVFVLAVAACWVARAPDEVSPAIVMTALGLLGVHVGTALAAGFPAAAAIAGPVARLWGRWTAVLAGVVLAVTGAAAALETWSRPGSVVLTIAGLAGLAALAWWWSARPADPGSSS